jgi:lysophospholipase L1-like esterase
MSSRQGRLLWKVSVPAVAALAALCLAEGAFRLLVGLGLVDYPRFDEARIVHRYSENPRLIYELKPSFTGQMIEGVVVRTNALGMRDREYSLVKPPGVIRIAVVGDSVAFGGDMEVEKLFSEVLEDELNETRPGGYEVLNYSVVGYNSEQEEIVLREKVLPAAPDAVFLAYCLNDDTYTDGLGELARELHPASLGPRLRSKLVSYLLHRRERRDFDKKADFAPVERLFGQLAALGRSANFKPVVIVFPYRYEKIETYPLRPKHDALRDLARRNGLMLVDFAEVWGGLSAEERSSLFTPDGIHLTPEGMRRVAEHLLSRPELYSRP